MPQSSPQPTPQQTNNTPPPEQLQGWRVAADEPDQLRRALQLAVDYRGDVTLALRNHEEPVVGFLFDAREADDPADTTLRLFVAGSADRQSIRLGDVEAIEFSGRDTAAGKSFDTWMKKYVKKKLAGEEASIHSDQH